MYDLVIKNGFIYDGTGQAPFEGDSGNGLIVILASLCVICLMGILLISRSISKKANS